MTDNNQADPDELAELFQDNDPPEPTALDRALQREFGDEWYLYPDDRAIVRQVARLTLALPNRETHLIERVVTAQQLVAAVSVEEGLESVQHACQDAALPKSESPQGYSVPDGTVRFVSGLARIGRHSEPGDFPLRSRAEADMSVPQSFPEQLPGLGEATEAARELIEAHREGNDIQLSLTELCETLSESGYTSAEIDKALSNIQRYGYVYVSADGDFRL
jgi:hypothetical protein